MNKLLMVIVVLFLLFSTVSLTPVNAARYAVCDQCGRCITPNPDPASEPTFPSPPQRWPECIKCLYGIDDDNTELSTKTTLQIPDAAPTPPRPTPGRFYTDFGCISTNLNDFTKPEAAAEVVRPFLNIIFSVTGAIAFIYLIYGAFLILTSHGDYEQLSQGKRTVWGSVIGLIFVLGSVFLINIIGRGILRLPGFS